MSGAGEHPAFLSTLAGLVSPANVLADAPSPTLEPGAFIAGGITFVGRATAGAIAQSRAVHRELLE